MALRDRLIFNVKWHRRIGLLCVIFVFLLSVTGLLLNHTSSLKLDSIKIHSSLLAALYNLPEAEPRAFQVNDQWLSHNGLDALYLNQENIDRCAPPLKGAVNSNGLLVVLCHNELLLLTQDGEPLERITPILGLPEDSNALAQAQDQLFIGSKLGPLQADLDSLIFTPVTAQVTWPSPQTPPAELGQFLNNQGPAMDLEQVLLDLHSGRLFGLVGVLLMDLVAILLIVLAITGFLAWQTSQKMRSKR